MEFKRLGKKLIACIVADTVCAAVLVKGNDGWQVEDMIPTKYLNTDKYQGIMDAIAEKLKALNEQVVFELEKIPNFIYE